MNVALGKQTALMARIKRYSAVHTDGQTDTHNAQYLAVRQEVQCIHTDRWTDTRNALRQAVQYIPSPRAIKTSPNGGSSTVAQTSLGHASSEVLVTMELTSGAAE